MLLLTKEVDPSLLFTAKTTTSRNTWMKSKEVPETLIKVHSINGSSLCPKQTDLIILDSQ